jgi:hypothetical protein
LVYEKNSMKDFAYTFTSRILFLHEATVEGWKINKLQTTYFTTEILYNEYELNIPYISKCLSFSIPFFVLVFIDSL